uniref:Transmembrane protein n=1 Tax=Macrostomum lignano TaxID=282301 RepID=A0A1I8JN75_9PLAT
HLKRAYPASRTRAAVTQRACGCRPVFSLIKNLFLKPIGRPCVILSRAASPRRQPRVATATPSLIVAASSAARARAKNARVLLSFWLSIGLPSAAAGSDSSQGERQDSVHGSGCNGDAARCQCLGPPLRLRTGRLTSTRWPDHHCGVRWDDLLLARKSWAAGRACRTSGVAGACSPLSLCLMALASASWLLLCSLADLLLAFLSLRGCRGLHTSAGLRPPPSPSLSESLPPALQGRAPSGESTAAKVLILYNLTMPGVCVGSWLASGRAEESGCRQLTRSPGENAGLRMEAAAVANRQLAPSDSSKGGSSTRSTPPPAINPVLPVVFVRLSYYRHRAACST